MLREALCESLSIAKDITSIGEAESGRVGIEMAIHLEPDVILLDVDIPGEDVTVTLATLAERIPRAKILIVTMHDDPVLVHQLSRMGTTGFLHKSASRDQLLCAIQNAARGDNFVLVTPRPPVSDLPTKSAATLTEREYEVLACVQVAMSNRQIARELGIAEGTVKRHLRNIFDKLGACSRLDALNRAQTGLTRVACQVDGTT